MSEIVCPCCGTASPEEALFCRHCGEPIRCQSCGTALLADARACIQCGRHIPGRESADSRFAHAGSVAPGYNHLSIHEKSDTHSYDLDFMFSNELGAQAGVSDVIANLGGFGDRAANSRPMASNAGHPKMVVESVEDKPAQPQLTSSIEDIAGAADLPEPHHAAGPMTPERALQEVFQRNGEKLTLMVSDLKATSQTDFTVRLVHIYMFARLTWFGEVGVQRSDLHDVTEYARLPQDNVSAYMSRDTLISRDGDTYSFRLGGADHAKKTLMEIVTSDTPGLWTPSAEASPAARSKKAPRRSSGGKTDEDTVAKVAEHSETLALVTDVPHSVIAVMNVMDKALVALYGLHKAGIEGELNYSLISEYLYRIFDTSVTGKTIGNALREASPTMSKYIVGKAGGGYRITQSGSEYVEKKYRSKPSSNGLPVQPSLVEP